MRSTTANISLALLTLMLFRMSSSAAAADVDVRLSAREAWVGSPVVLQISLNNAEDYEQPNIPDIDGCDIRSAGAPQQSSQTTIINGRRTDSRSVMMRYLITPRREGSFEIPPFSLKVDGRSVTTEKLRFVATKSETGNLLFVEIEGGKEKVFVGQPLELTLKIWIKPFHDAERDITLSEAHMWQLISEQTSWGSFLERMKELAAENQRPGGKEVLRDDGQGSERSYYLYEITAMVYPKRPGKIDADDVQIVIDYPTELGKARDPFAGFFEDSGFGGRSPLSQMMGDDFFSSPFSNRLTVSQTRPITGDAQVDATEVLPVPTEGRPADYRGAVGRYKIVTQATPTAVNAGDSITLNIGIEGTGPMDLVQAPPLSELPSLTADFKVADQSLAGFVQDTTKLFSTTIRPRREGITQIPAIPFSFFDPDTGKYETAMSDPIAITVDKSESLSLDAIVGRQRQSGESPKETATASRQMLAEFTNDNSAAALVPQSPAGSGEWWWFFVVAPPIAWLTTVMIRHRGSILRRLPRFRSAKSLCLAALEHASEPTEVVAALTRYIENRTSQACATSTIAIGALRTSGMMQAAIDVEAFFQRCEQSQFSDSSQQSLTDCRREANALVDRIESSVDSIGKSQVRRTKRTSTGRASTARKISSAAYRVPILIIAAVFASATSDAIMAADSSPFETPASTATDQSQDTSKLSSVQQQLLLSEAGDLYSQATAKVETDSADAVDLFTAAAQKYQLLVDSGIHNARLYRNLGNACLQSNQPGRAIANYERARQLDPTDRQLIVNLKFANSLIKGGDSQANNATVTAGDPTSFKSMVEKIRISNAMVIDLIGMHMITWTLVVSSVVFWSLQISRAAGYRFPVWRFAIVPLLLLTTSLTSVVLATTEPRSTSNGIIVANNTTLHSGDGEQFDAVFTLDAAQGHRVEILTTRGQWAQIRTRHGHIGWLPARDVEKL